MGNLFDTGNERVDQVSRLSITGNVIPMAWYKTIRKQSGKPNLNAIVILADVVYWYRAAEVRDEGSGQLIGCKKRFRSDLLQRSYQQIADQFGITKRDATNAVVELEKMGVLKRVFRTMESNGIRTANVLFLDLDPDVLERLTFPQEGGGEGGPTEIGDTPSSSSNGVETEPTTRVPPKAEGGVTQIGERVSLKTGTPPTEKGRTNTENTTETTYRDYPIPSIERMEEGFKKQIEYNSLVYDLSGDDRERLDELVRIGVDVLTSEAGTIRVNGEEKPRKIVQSQFLKLDMTHIRYVMESLERTCKRVVNVRAVLITAMYNAVNTITSHYHNRVQADMVGGGGY